jgi:carboxynorspermidine decarboxylase
MEDEYGIDKDIEIDFDMDVKEGIWKPAKNGRYRYRLSSYTCLAGDIIGDYQFGREINVGDRLVFEDMAIYSMVKNNTFNGIPLPDIVIMDSDGECKVWKHFGYEDFKGRL